MENKYAEMKVAELRAESKKRGMTLEHKGHKFTKQELIDRLIENDSLSENQNQEEKVNMEAETSVVASTQETDENWMAEFETEEEETAATQEVSEQEQKKIMFANTLEEIEQKYGKRKKQEIYDLQLKPGCFVVFVHYVEAADGNTYKKLRTAKVVAVNRKQERVRVETLLGTQIEMRYDDLLFIKGTRKTDCYPCDIKTYLKSQRTEKGRELINERLGEKLADRTDTVNQ